MLEVIWSGELLFELLSQIEAWNNVFVFIS